MAIFTVDWEAWHDAIYLPGTPRYAERLWSETTFLLDLLKKYKVKAIFYTLGRLRFSQGDLLHKIKTEGHVIGDHGFNHEHWLYGEGLFRSPYWDTTPMPWPPSGGFFFRLMPLWYIKWAVKKSGVFWIHPHDIDESHPRLKNPFLNWKRHVGLKTARKKLERLLREVKFAQPSEN